MNEVRFTTREIGSLAKPGWRVKSIAGRPVEKNDVEDAQKWGSRLGIEDYDVLVNDILIKGMGFTDEEKARIQNFSALYGLRLLENAGLDVVYDGEQRRSEMYDHAVRHAKGFETRGTVRAFDNKYYTKAAVVENPLVETVYDLEEYEFVQSHTDRQVKVPFTGAYTIMDWSYDEYYARDGTLLGATAQKRYLGPDRRTRRNDPPGGDPARRGDLQRHPRGRKCPRQHAYLLLRLHQPLPAH